MREKERAREKKKEGERADGLLVFQGKQALLQWTKNATEVQRVSYACVCRCVWFVRV
jgi:hypothetical protein